MSRKSFSEISWLVDEPTYRQDPALSYSTLAKYEREGRFDSLPTLFERISTPSLTFGSMVDCLITDSEEAFNEQFLVMELPQISDSLKEIVTILHNKFGEPNEFNQYYEHLSDIPDEELAKTGKECGYYTADKYAAYRVKNIRKGCTKYYDMLNLAVGKTLVSQKDVDDAYAAVEALRSNPNTSFYFGQQDTEDIERFYQLKFKGTDAERGVNYRSMAD